ncbi:MAG: YitT family protein [Ahrensia sp.]|nr:YitT family protein [Ahrensia sp.]
MTSTTKKTSHDPITLARESRHTLIEDVFAISVGVILVSFGVFLFKQAGIVLGGIAGISLIASYVTGWKFGLLFFAINLPFYFFGFGSMGLSYIIKTFCAVVAMSLLVPLFPSYIAISSVHPALASIAGGAMIGLGLLALFRHGAGLGGINILVYWLQTNRNMRAGYVQLGIDAVILIAASFVITPTQLIWSIVGALIFNMILGVNHKPGRYMGAS